MPTSTINIQIPFIWKSALYPVCCGLAANGDMLFMDVFLLCHYITLWRLTFQYKSCIIWLIKGTPPFARRFDPDMIGWNRQTHRLAVSVYFLSITQRETMATISKPSWQMLLNVTYVFILSPSFRRVTEPPDGIPYAYILANICSQVKRRPYRKARKGVTVSFRAFFYYIYYFKSVLW